jgi:hypothetical protein
MKNRTKLFHNRREISYLYYSEWHLENYKYPSTFIIKTTKYHKKAMLTRVFFVLCIVVLWQNVIGTLLGCYHCPDLRVYNYIMTLETVPNDLVDLWSFGCSRLLQLSIVVSVSFSFMGQLRPPKLTVTWTGQRSVDRSGEWSINGRWLLQICEKLISEKEISRYTRRIRIMIKSREKANTTFLSGQKVTQRVEWGYYPHSYDLKISYPLILKRTTIKSIHWYFV